MISTLFQMCFIFFLLTTGCINGWLLITETLKIQTKKVQFLKFKISKFPNFQLQQQKFTISFSVFSELFELEIECLLLTYLLYNVFKMWSNQCIAKFTILSISPFSLQISRLTFQHNLLQLSFLVFNFFHFFSVPKISSSAIIVGFNTLSLSSS